MPKAQTSPDVQSDALAQTTPSVLALWHAQPDASASASAQRRMFVWPTLAGYREPGRGTPQRMNESPRRQISRLLPWILLTSRSTAASNTGLM